MSRRPRYTKPDEGMSDAEFDAMLRSLSWWEAVGSQPLVLTPVMFKAVAREFKARGLPTPKTIIENKPIPLA